jgi:hypothetical protein
MSQEGASNDDWSESELVYRIGVSVRGSTGPPTDVIPAKLMGARYRRL